MHPLALVGGVAEIWGAEPKSCCVKVVRLKGKYVRSLASRPLRGAAHPVVNIRTSEHHIPSRLSVRMFGSSGKNRANVQVVDGGE